MNLEQVRKAKLARALVKYGFKQIPRLDLVLQAIREDNCLLDGSIYDGECG